MGHLGGPGGRILLLIDNPKNHRNMMKATRGKQKRVGTKVEGSIMINESPQENLSPRLLYAIIEEKMGDCENNLCLFKNGVSVIMILAWIFHRVDVSNVEWWGFTTMWLEVKS